MDAKDIALIKALGGGGSGGSITVDSELSDTSKNPVQNKVIKSALDALKVQPDWNQNDSTAADYVKNRPFYSGDPVETVVVEESTVMFVDTGSGFYGGRIQSTFKAKVGETYKVYWDGTVYECICVFAEGVLAIGNLSIVGAGSDTGEPFVIQADDGVRLIIGTKDTSSYHTVSISSIVGPVVKIDSKYIHPFNPNDQDISGIPTPVQIKCDDSLHPIIGKTTFGQLKNRKAVFDSVFYDDTNLLRLRLFDVIHQDGTRTIEYTGIDTQRMRVCAIEFCFDGSADDSILTNVNMNYPNGMYIKSSTPNSTKHFKITVDDSGAITATQV